MRNSLHWCANTNIDFYIVMKVLCSVVPSLVLPEPVVGKFLPVKTMGVLTHLVIMPVIHTLYVHLLWCVNIRHFEMHTVGVHKE